MIVKINGNVVNESSNGVKGEERTFQGDKEVTLANDFLQTLLIFCIYYFLVANQVTGSERNVNLN